MHSTAFLWIVEMEGFSSFFPPVPPFLPSPLRPTYLQIFAPFDPDFSPRYCTVFTHLIKSGGQSVKGQLREESERLDLPKPGRCSQGMPLFRMTSQSFDVGRVNQPSFPSWPMFLEVKLWV